MRPSASSRSSAGSEASAVLAQLSNPIAMAVLVSWACSTSTTTCVPAFQLRFLTLNTQWRRSAEFSTDSGP